MDKSFTLNNLLRSAYGELSEPQEWELDSVCRQYPELVETSAQLIEMQQLLEHGLDRPSAGSLQNILEYSRHGRSMKV